MTAAAQLFPSLQSPTKEIKSRCIARHSQRQVSQCPAVRLTLAPLAKEVHFVSSLQLLPELGHPRLKKLLGRTRMSLSSTTQPCSVGRRRRVATKMGGKGNVDTLITPLAGAAYTVSFR